MKYEVENTVHKYIFSTQGKYKQDPDTPSIYIYETDGQRTGNAKYIQDDPSADFYLRKVIIPAMSGPMVALKMLTIACKISIVLRYNMLDADGAETQSIVSDEIYGQRVVTKNLTAHYVFDIIPEKFVIPSQGYGELITIGILTPIVNEISFNEGTAICEFSSCSPALADGSGPDPIAPDETILVSDQTGL